MSAVEERYREIYREATNNIIEGLNNIANGRDTMNQELNVKNIVDSIRILNSSSDYDLILTSESTDEFRYHALNRVYETNNRDLLSTLRRYVNSIITTESFFQNAVNYINTRAMLNTYPNSVFIDRARNNGRRKVTINLTIPAYEYMNGIFWRSTHLNVVTAYMLTPTIRDKLRIDTAEDLFLENLKLAMIGSDGSLYDYFDNNFKEADDGVYLDNDGEIYEDTDLSEFVKIEYALLSLTYEVESIFEFMTTVPDASFTWKSEAWIRGEDNITIEMGEDMTTKNQESYDFSKETPIIDGVLSDINQKLVNYRNDIRNYSNDIESYYNSIASKQAGIANYSHQIALLERIIADYSPESNWRSKIATLIKEIRDTEKLLGLDFISGGFYSANNVTTFTMIFTARAVYVSGMFIPVRSYRVSYNLNTGKYDGFKVIRWFNGTYDQAYIHPHVNSDIQGSVCMGNASQYVSQCTTLSDYIAIHQAPLMYYNVESPYRYRELINISLMNVLAQLANTIKKGTEVEPLYYGDYLYNKLFAPYAEKVVSYTRNTRIYWHSSIITARATDQEQHYRNGTINCTAHGSSMQRVVTYQALGSSMNNFFYTGLEGKKILDAEYVEGIKRSSPTALNLFIINHEFIKQWVGYEGNSYDMEESFAFNKEMFSRMVNINGRALINNVYLASSITVDDMNEWWNEIKGIAPNDFRKFSGVGTEASEDTLQKQFEDIVESLSIFRYQQTSEETELNLSIEL